jgi:hypothetical protein
VSDERDIYAETVESLRSAGEVVAAAERGMFREGIEGPNAPPRHPDDPPQSLEVGFEEVTRLADVAEETVDRVLIPLEALYDECDMVTVREAIEEAEAEWLYEYVFARAFAFVRSPSR